MNIFYGTKIARKWLITAGLLLSLFAQASTDVSSRLESLDTAPVDLLPAPQHLQSSRYIAKFVSDLHYARPRLDNARSEAILDKYIELLDPNKAYFLAADIDKFSRYRHTLDNAILTGWLRPAYDIYDRFQQRWRERLEYALSLLDEPMDFSQDEYFYYDRENLPWAVTRQELDSYWKKRVKNEALNLLIADKEWEEVQEILRKRYKAALRRANQVKSEDVFSYFMNAFTNTVDPHTAYFSPQTAENFDIDMKLSLEGIGAVLQSDDVYTKINRIVPKGPADKSGQLKVNDKVIAVGQGENGPLVDVVGWRLDDVVQLIRGDAGTVVRLKIEPANTTVQGKTKIVSIVREKVKLEEQAAKSKVLEVNELDQKRTVGVIELPKFYVDFKAKYEGKKDYRSTTRDVRLLIEKMKRENNIDALIIDLRSNGGGALDEATALTGLFIDKGPVVQDRNRRGRIEVLGDDDPGTVWDGPLAVLVNGSSASASEIFAGAIQDYDRGIIVGEDTFGKGTVQRVLDLNSVLRNEENAFGALKLTINKFYRITGASTQIKGVKPDIPYPDPIPRDEFGEGSYDYALPWDEIPAVEYQPENRVRAWIPMLQTMHEKRIVKDQEFQYLIEDIERIKERRKLKRISLNFDTRKKELEHDRQIELARENARRAAVGKPPLKEIDEDTELTEPEDAKLMETARILADLIELKSSKLAKKDA